MTAPRNMLACCSLLAASFFALCTTHALAADLVRVGKASATTFAFAPIEIGKEKGIWAKNNLDVESIGFGGDARLQPPIVAAPTTFSLSSLPRPTFPSKP